MGRVGASSAGVLEVLVASRRVGSERLGVEASQQADHPGNQSQHRRDAALRVREATLLDLLDRVLDRGVILAGDVTLSVADVDLIYLGLRVLVAPVERLPEIARRAEDREREVVYG